MARTDLVIMSSNRRPPVRKVNFPDTWPPAEVISMYTQLKAAVDEAKRGKKEGRVKRVFMKRDHEYIARQIFEKKRRITFRNDTGSCEVSPDSQYDLDQEWKIGGWFDASQIALKLLHPDYKKATAVMAEGQQGATGQPLEPQDSNRAPPGNGLGIHYSGAKKRPAPSNPPADAPPARRMLHNPAAGQPAIVAPAHNLSQTSNAARQPLQQAYIYQEPLFDPTANAGERVAINQLTSTGAARVVEIALRTTQPQAIHSHAHYRAGQRLVAEGITGMDLLQCTADDLKGIVKGPPCRRETVANAVSEFTRMGGIPSEA